MVCLLQEDASNTTILGLLLECSLPKSVFNNPQVLHLPSLRRFPTWLSVCVRLGGCGFQTRPGHSKDLETWTWSEASRLLTAPSDEGSDEKDSVCVLFGMWQSVELKPLMFSYKQAQLWEETLTLNPPKLTLKLEVKHLFLQWKL